LNVERVKQRFRAIWRVFFRFIAFMNLQTLRYWNWSLKSFFHVSASVKVWDFIMSHVYSKLLELINDILHRKSFVVSEVFRRNVSFALSSSNLKCISLAQNIRGIILRWSHTSRVLTLFDFPTIVIILWFVRRVLLLSLTGSELGRTSLFIKLWLGNLRSLKSGFIKFLRKGLFFRV